MRFLALLCCLFACNGSSINIAHLDSDPNTWLVGTTYFGAPNDPGAGPGHFACMGDYEKVNQWYIAPSDTFTDPKVWGAPICPPSASGGVPDCTTIMNQYHICGRRIRVHCGGSNCRIGAPDVVAEITDACPKYHPVNEAHHECQGGDHFDLGYPVWQVLRGWDDNIKVYYEVVDPGTPLGPVK